jgi:CheY-like chemotaxis protein
MNSTAAIDTFDALIVDDEPALRQAMARAFARRGFRCDLAANGNEALRRLAGQSYDVLVTDLCMPEMHGHDLVVGLLQRAKRPVVIVVTGVTDQRLERDLRARGVDEILFKPVDYALLAARAEALVELRAAKLEGQAGSANELPSSPIADVMTGQRSITSDEKPAGDDCPPSSVALSASATASTPPPREAQPAAADPADSLAIKIERLEHELSILAAKRNPSWIWLVVVFQTGLLSGWLLARCAG